MQGEGKPGVDRRCAVTRRRTPSDWKAEVYRRRDIPETVRVLLIWLGDSMKADRTVSRPRSEMAHCLGISENKVSQRISRAHELGWLSTVAKGYRGSTAVYQGTFAGTQKGSGNRKPLGAERGTATTPLSLSKIGTLSTEESVTPGGNTSTTADLSVSTHDRDDGTDRSGGESARSEPCWTCAGDGCADCDGTGCVA